MRKALASAYARNPSVRQTLQLLADLCNRAGDATQSQIYALLAQWPQETTAAEPLKAAWDDCIHAQWASADQAVQRAAAIDPADARAPAYLSVIEANRDHPDVAAARRLRWRRWRSKKPAPS